MVMAPPPTHDSAVSPCFHGYLAFFHRHFPPVSSLTSPQSVSLQSTAALALGLLPVRKRQLLATAPSRRPAFLPSICMAVARTVWISFHSGCHRSAVSLSALNVSPLTQTVAPLLGSDPASVPPPSEGRSSPTNTPVSPRSSFILRSFAWFCVFFSTGQVLLSAPSWCSACTSVSEGEFLMYPWREVYSTSTYSSAIFFSLSF